MRPTERWRSQLAAWAIPQELLDAVDESPYGWSQSLWARRSETARSETSPPHTTIVVRRLAGEHGSVLDIGAGRGRASLALAVEGHRVVAVERDAEMRAGLAEEVARAGVDVAIIDGRWPDVANQVGEVDVSMCAHVVYDVSDIGPFVSAMADVARSGVAIEMTHAHPWSGMAPYYRALHGLDRPAGPTADDLVEVVEEVTGVRPNVDRWTRSGQLWFENWDEIFEFYGRRLVLPRSRRHELRELLEPDVVEDGGRLFIGGEDRRLATIWWSFAS